MVLTKVRVVKTFGIVKDRGVKTLELSKSEGQDFGLVKVRGVRTLDLSKNPRGQDFGIVKVRRGQTLNKTNKKEKYMFKSRPSGLGAITNRTYNSILKKKS